MVSVRVMPVVRLKATAARTGRQAPLVRASLRGLTSVGALGSSAAVSMRRLMFHCCAIDSTVLVTQ